ncbi:entericidin A/B family lipoprotein [Alteromonas pelagimontana]|uniref:Entericidin A/B family lipoprotein n=1 Tax=Alteromonas pelagimontana TaxID=1858656 RepID=A0A6M4MJT9_9ALTE|nr:entericidin A/B family lipoprotein [Alteromonas pelagimontana]QJR82356.1 entericidin A/B family lipoprotein [Alteromonas pelagimontana]
MKSLYTSRRLRSQSLVLLMAFLGSLLTGCATMEGAGEDIQSAGESVEDASEDAQN